MEYGSASSEFGGGGVGNDSMLKVYKQIYILLPQYAEDITQALTESKLEKFLTDFKKQNSSVTMRNANNIQTKIHEYERFKEICDNALVTLSYDELQEKLSSIEKFKDGFSTYMMTCVSLNNDFEVLQFKFARLTVLRDQILKMHNAAIAITDKLEFDNVALELVKQMAYKQIFEETETPMYYIKYISSVDYSSYYGNVLKGIVERMPSPNILFEFFFTKLLEENITIVSADNFVKLLEQFAMFFGLEICKQYNKLGGLRDSESTQLLSSLNSTHGHLFDGPAKSFYDSAADNAIKTVLDDNEKKFSRGVNAGKKKTVLKNLKINYKSLNEKIKTCELDINSMNSTMKETDTAHKLKVQNQARDADDKLTIYIPLIKELEDDATDRFAAIHAIVSPQTVYFANLSLTNKESFEKHVYAQIDKLIINSTNQQRSYSVVKQFLTVLHTQADILYNDQSNVKNQLSELGKYLIPNEQWFNNNGYEKYVEMCAIKDVTLTITETKYNGKTMTKKEMVELAIGDSAKNVLSHLKESSAEMEHVHVAPSEGGGGVGGGGGGGGGGGFGGWGGGIRAVGNSFRAATEKTIAAVSSGLGSVSSGLGSRFGAVSSGLGSRFGAIRAYNPWDVGITTAGYGGPGSSMDDDNGDGESTNIYNASHKNVTSIHNAKQISRRKGLHAIEKPLHSNASSRLGSGGGGGGGGGGASSASSVSSGLGSGGGGGMDEEIKGGVSSGLVGSANGWLGRGFGGGGGGGGGASSASSGFGGSASSIYQQPQQTNMQQHQQTHQYQPQQQWQQQPPVFSSSNAFFPNGGGGVKIEKETLDEDDFIIARQQDLSSPESIFNELIILHSNYVVERDFFNKFMELVNNLDLNQLINFYYYLGSQGFVIDDINNNMEKKDFENFLYYKRRQHGLPIVYVPVQNRPNGYITFYDPLSKDEYNLSEDELEQFKKHQLVLLEEDKLKNALWKLCIKNYGLLNKFRDLYKTPQNVMYTEAPRDLKTSKTLKKGGSKTRKPKRHKKTIKRNPQKLMSRRQKYSRRK